MNNSSGEAKERGADVLQRAIALGISIEPVEGNCLEYRGPAAAINELGDALARHRDEIHRLLVADHDAGPLDGGPADRDADELRAQDTSGLASVKMDPPEFRDPVQITLPFV
jgi:hypothetical protein